MHHGRWRHLLQGLLRAAALLLALPLLYGAVAGGLMLWPPSSHLTGEPAVIMARQAARQGHYMPASLVASQFAALEDPRGEPDVVAVPVDSAPDMQLQQALAALD